MIIYALFADISNVVAAVVTEKVYEIFLVSDLYEVGECALPNYLQVRYVSLVCFPRVYSYDSFY